MAISTSEINGIVGALVRHVTQQIELLDVRAAANEARIAAVESRLALAEARVGMLEAILHGDAVPPASLPAPH